VTEQQQEIEISAPAGEDAWDRSDDEQRDSGRDGEDARDERRPSSDGASDDDNSSPQDEGRGKQTARKSKLSIGDAIDLAQEIVLRLAGHRPESVSGISKSEDGGWTVALDVVELSRIPPSTDMMATFEVTLGGDGELSEFGRVRRYVRSQANED
jgi:hypothetical protein